MSDFFGRAAANDGSSVCRRRFGRSGGDLELLLWHQTFERPVGLDPVETVGEGVDAAVQLHEVLAFDLPAAAEFATPCSERYVLLVRSTRPLSSGDLGGMTLIVFNPRYLLMTAPCTAAPSQAFAKVGDGNAISWLRYRSFWCFGDEPVQLSVRVSFLVRHSLFGGGVTGAFVHTCSGMRSACFLSL